MLGADDQSVGEDLGHGDAVGRGGVDGSEELDAGGGGGVGVGVEVGTAVGVGGATPNGKPVSSRLQAINCGPTLTQPV